MVRRVVPLYIFSFFMIMPIVGLVPLLPMIRDDLRASYSQIAVFVAFLGIVRILFALPVGILADRVDRKKVLLLGGILSVSGLIVLSFSQTLFHLIISRILIGTGSIISSITVLVILAQVATIHAKGTIMSLNHVVNNAGSIISAALAGFLAHIYNWRVPFLVFAGLILCSLMVIAFTFTDRREDFLKEPDPSHAETASGPPGDFGKMIIQIIPVFAISFFVFFYRSSFRQTLIPFYGKDVFHIDVVDLGLFVSLISLIAMVSVFTFGFLSDIYGRKPVFISALFFSMAAVVCLLLPETMNPLLVTCVVVGIGSPINSMPNILISDLVPGATLGRMLALNRIFSNSGYFVGAIITGSLLDYFGFRIPLFFLLGFALFIFILALFFIPGISVRPAGVIDGYHCEGGSHETEGSIQGSA